MTWLVQFQALIHGLNRHYYSIAINYRKNELEQKMLLNLHKKSWVDGFTLEDYSKHCTTNENTVKEMLELAKNYHKVYNKTNKMPCAPSEDSDQPGHPPSLIRVFAVCMMKAWALSYPLSTAKTLIRLGGCLGWSESSLSTCSFLAHLSRQAHKVSL